jgi:hypothetical protein
MTDKVADLQQQIEDLKKQLDRKDDLIKQYEQFCPLADVLSTK